MSEVKLLPCPFCGSENIMLDKTKEDTLHLAVCRNCVAEVSGFTRDGAIRAWNTRKPMDDVETVLKKISDDYKNSADPYEQGKAFAYNNAIGIVRGGGE